MGAASGERRAAAVVKMKSEEGTSYAELGEFGLSLG